MPHCEGQVRVETQLVTEPLQGGNGLTQKGKPLEKKQKTKLFLFLFKSKTGTCSLAAHYLEYMGLLLKA